MYQVDKNSTQFNENTPFGWHTPFKFPTVNLDLEILLGLASDLYPTGSVWNLNENSNFAKLHTAINKSMLEFINFSYSVIDSSIPDNDNFDIFDTRFLEYKLGLDSNESINPQQRKDNLLAKMSYPKNIKARQGFKYLEQVLNDYGFNVGIYENLFYNEDGTSYHLNPSEILGSINSNTQHGGNTQHGQSTQHGGGSYDVIANSMFDEKYNIGGEDNLWATFFVAGNTINEIAVIPELRKREFRELILKLKPAHLVAFLYINFN